MSNLLPPNATAQEHALDDSTARLSDVPPRVRDVWNPDTCPANLLPWLAWAYSVDEWDTTWVETQKREAIKQAVTVHRYKGTIGAVRDALAAIGVSVQVQEWFNQIPAGEPYTYQMLMEVDQIGISQVTLEKLLRVVNSTKNLRSHMSRAVPIVRTRSRLYLGGANSLGNEVTIAFDQGQVSRLDGTWTLDGSRHLAGLAG